MIKVKGDRGEGDEKGKRKKETGYQMNNVAFYMNFKTYPFVK